jgi:hypothetical protein
MSTAASWACSACTLQNDASLLACSVCGSARSSNFAPSGPNWTCAACTFAENASAASRCAVCESRRVDVGALTPALPALARQCIHFAVCGRLANEPHPYCGKRCRDRNAIAAVTSAAARAVHAQAMASALASVASAPALSSAASAAAAAATSSSAVAAATSSSAAASRGPAAPVPVAPPPSTALAASTASAAAAAAARSVDLTRTLNAAATAILCIAEQERSQLQNKKYRKSQKQTQTAAEAADEMLQDIAQLLTDLYAPIEREFTAKRAAAASAASKAPAQQSQCQICLEDFNEADVVPCFRNLITIFVLLSILIALLQDLID